jgi:hypothetical protein
MCIEKESAFIDAWPNFVCLGILLQAFAGAHPMHILG